MTNQICSMCRYSRECEVSEEDYDSDYLWCDLYKETIRWDFGCRKWEGPDGEE